MNEIITFQYQTKVKDMYRYQMRYNYTGYKGITNMVISVGALALLITGAGGGDAFSNLMLIMAASLFTIITPIQLFYKAAKQVKLTPMFQKPIDYSISMEGLQLSQAQDKLVIQWEDIHKVIETKYYFYIYLSVNGAYILPKEALDQHCVCLREIIQKYAVNAKKNLRNRG